MVDLDGVSSIENAEAIFDELVIDDDFLAGIEFHRISRVVWEISRDFRINSYLRASHEPPAYGAMLYSYRISRIVAESLGRSPHEFVYSIIIQPT